MLKNSLKLIFLPSMNALKSLKFKPLSFNHWKHEETISADDTKTPKPHHYLKIIPSTWIEWFKEDA